MSDSKKAYKNWKVQQGSDIIFPNQVWQAACEWQASAQDGGGLPVGLVCQLNHHRNGWIDIQITGHSKKSTVFTVVGAGSMEYLTEAEAYDFRATPACHLKNDNSPVFIRVAKKTEEGGFDFVEIETAEGIGVNIEGVQDREFHLLGPLYRQPPSAVVPSGVWQFYQDGEWHTGMNNIHHRAHTEAAGYKMRDLWATQDQDPLN
jgi:hypothetical protein